MYRSDRFGKLVAFLGGYAALVVTGSLLCFWYSLFLCLLSRAALPQISIYAVLFSVCSYAAIPTQTVSCDFGTTGECMFLSISAKSAGSSERDNLAILSME